MSWSERSVRYHKRQTDCAIHCAYARLVMDRSAVAKFHELLHVARGRAARLLEAPILDGLHPGVEALVNLSRFKSAHIRPATDWLGTTSSWRPAVSLLARHLICKYEVPAFLATSWYATDSAADKKRGWFVAHSRGASFRSLDLPILMTRKMEHAFLASHDHWEIEHAIRRAELLALGASSEVVQAVLSTRLAADLSNGEFWRTVWLFLVANASVMDPAQIAPMIDFIQAIRHDRLAVETAGGIVELDPPQPAFSMRGRTVQSMLRLMRDWHGSLGVGGAGVAWTPSPLQPMLLEEPSQDPSAPPRRWQVLELTSAAQLRTEGAALRHCVASYADRCRRGTSRIWSVRFHRGESVHHVLTIEIDPKRRTVVQARGLANRVASGKPLRVLRDWADRERIRMAI
jgi:PcfJ-like protein